MFDFIDSIRNKSRSAESRFACTLDIKNVVYTKFLLESIYELKKSARKYNTACKIIKKNPSSKTFQARNNYIIASSVFMTRFNYVHMIFTIFLTPIITKNFDIKLHSFGSLIKHPEFFKIFDSHERMILRKFNQLRNVLVHTPYIELFSEFDESEFLELQNLSVALVDLEKQMLYFLRLNSFFSPYSHSDIEFSNA